MLKLFGPNRETWCVMCNSYSCRGWREVSDAAQTAGGRRQGHRYAQRSASLEHKRGKGDFVAITFPFELQLLNHFQSVASIVITDRILEKTTVECCPYVPA